LLSAGKTKRIRDHYLGEVYGLEYFGILARSRITLNIHIDVAQGVASNMRLFEATGCGALLMTEKSVWLSHFFEPGREVVTFDNKDDLIAKATLYLGRADEREQIAHAGQERTLTQYTSHRRAEELVDLLKS
jgi:spore maturation protein CgeB